MDVALVTRIKDLNGDFPVRGTELIDEKLLKEWSVGLNVDDIREFIDWLTSSSRVAVSGREKLRAKLQDLQHFRKAAWHVFCPDGIVPAEKRMCIVLLDSRKFFVFSFTGNLETVMKLKNCVDASQLGIGVQPGTIYHDLKMDPTKTPKWELLQKAGLWKNKAQYEHSVWSWLTSTKQEWSVAASQALVTQGGTVIPVDVEIGDRREKLMCGTLSSILNTRSLISLILVELKESAEDPFPSEVSALITSLSNKKVSVRLILWGTPKAVDQALAGSVEQLMAGGCPLVGYKQRRIEVFLNNEACYGERVTGYSSVHRVAVILNPQPMRASYGYMVSQVGWVPTLVDQLILIAGVAMWCHKGRARQMTTTCI